MKSRIMVFMFNGDDIENRIQLVRNSYNRHLFVVGNDTAFKEFRDFLVSRFNFPVLDVSLELSKALKNLNYQDRIYELPDILFGLVVSGTSGDVVILDRIEILFESALQHEPITVLEKISRFKTLIIRWCGEYDGKYLWYSESGHPEYLKREMSEGMVVTL